jgi:leucyl/phenylalanyl-tRNA--protein transferase
MQSSDPSLLWLTPGDDFPPVTEGWGPGTPAPGLLAAGGALDVATLKRAYSAGIFPWFGRNEPILWWSTDPRMVLQTARFKLHPSLRKTLRRFRLDAQCEIRFDSAFSQVIHACSTSVRAGQSGTWIVPDMVRAYQALHEAGCAHSVETWVRGELVGGLYAVSMGKAVFGESMFAKAPDASKIALAALVSFCRAHDIAMIDCQQNTRHLASLGAAEMPRADFLKQVEQGLTQPTPHWEFQPQYWDELMPQAALPA